jgi:hypothetical protein
MVIDAVEFSETVRHSAAGEMFWRRSAAIQHWLMSDQDLAPGCGDQADDSASRSINVQRIDLTMAVSLKYRVSHIRCSTARHERDCAACSRREQGKATLRRLAAVKT